MNCGAQTLVRVNLDGLTLEGYRGHRNFVLDAEIEVQHMQQIAAQGAVFGGSLFANPLKRPPASIERSLKRANPLVPHGTTPLTLSA